LEICRRLQQDQALKDIPVIFLTSLGRQEDEVRCFETGGVDFVTKPFSPIVLRSRVATQVRLKQQAELLQFQATRDGLTGLFNRREFNALLDREWRACQQDHEQLAILMMDIDHFKLYNNSYGHQKGDRCLQLVAGAVRGQLKRGRDCVARYGGEEFVCLLPQTNPQAAQLIGEKILAAVQALAIPHAASLTTETVSISVGGACEALFTGKSSASLLKRADDSLYQAKEQGRNRLIFHRC
jgi:diguanylate cyclase (GGDEF)-like protein